MKRLNYFRMIAMFAAVFAMAFVSACSDKDEPEPEPTPEVPEEQEPEPVEPIDYSRGEIELDNAEQAFAEDFMSYSLKTFRLVAEETDANVKTKDTSVVYSPIGLSYVTGLLANASGGETRQEVLDTYSHSGLTLDVLNKFHKTVKTALPEIDRTSTVALANSVWTRMTDKSNISESFYDRMLCYDAEVNFLTDFGNMDEVEKINKWADENTFGFLPKLFPNPLSTDIRFMLINTLYFKGAWTTEFDVKKTAKATFHNVDGTETQVDMMHHDWLNSCVGFFDRFTLLRLPYGNEAYCMLLFLPKTGVGLEECLSEMESHNDEILSWAKSSGEGRDMNISLPKFDVSSDLKILSILSSLGIKRAFELDQVDWSGMYSNSDEVKAVLSGGAQIVRVAVDEKKSEAAAITYVDAAESGYDPDFTCDRPFMFMIAEQSTGLPLFMGRVTKF